MDWKTLLCDVDDFCRVTEPGLWVLPFPAQAFQQGQSAQREQQHRAGLRDGRCDRDDELAAVVPEFIRNQKRTVRRQGVVNRRAPGGHVRGGQAVIDVAGQSVFGEGCNQVRPGNQLGRDTPVRGQIGERRVPRGSSSVVRQAHQPDRVGLAGREINGLLKERAGIGVGPPRPTPAFQVVEVGVVRRQQDVPVDVVFERGRREPAHVGVRPSEPDDQGLVIARGKARRQDGGIAGTADRAGESQVCQGLGRPAEVPAGLVD